MFKETICKKCGLPVKWWFGWYHIIYSSQCYETENRINLMDTSKFVTVVGDCDTPIPITKKSDPLGVFVFIIFIPLYIIALIICFVDENISKLKAKNKGAKVLK